MTQQYPSKVASIASELRWDESVGFLDDAIRADGAVAPLYLQPSFAEGSVYSASMSTSMLVQVPSPPAARALPPLFLSFLRVLLLLPLLLLCDGGSGDSGGVAADDAEEGKM